MLAWTSANSCPMTFNGLRLKSALALTFGLMAAVLSASLTLLIAHHSSDNERRAVSTRLGSIAEVTAYVLDIGMYERMHDITMLADADVLQDRQRNATGRRLLESLQAGHPEYAWLGVIDAEGRVLYGSHGDREGEDMQQKPWFNHGLTPLYLGDVHQSDWLPPLKDPHAAGESRRSLDMAAPIQDAEGNVTGRLAAQLSWEWARNIEGSMLTPARRQAGIEFFIVGRDGNLLLAPRGKADTVLPPLEKLGEASTLVWPDGREYLTGVRGSKGWGDFPGTGWKVVVRQPADKAFASVHQLQQYILGAGLVLTLFFALLGMGLAWFLSRPLTQLARNADHLRQHPGSMALHGGGLFRETRQLSRSFGQLLAELQDHQDQLAALNASLEQQVQDRTQAVEMANRHLLALLEERGKLMEQLEALAATDSLTGLLNRRAFHERAELECKRSQRQQSPLTALTFDIDHFKHVNDNYGHDVGDEALRQCASACREQLREIDLLARFGGEEFVILLPETDIEAGRQVAERLREALAALRIPTSQGELRFTASFGVAPHDAANALEVTLQQADQALYAAKHSGRNRVVVFF